MAWLLLPLMLVGLGLVQLAIASLPAPRSTRLRQPADGAGPHETPAIDASLIRRARCKRLPRRVDLRGRRRLMRPVDVLTHELAAAWSPAKPPAARAN